MYLEITKGILLAFSIIYLAIVLAPLMDIILVIGILFAAILLGIFIFIVYPELLFIIFLLTCYFFVKEKLDKSKLSITFVKWQNSIPWWKRILFLILITSIVSSIVLAVLYLLLLQ